MKQFFLKIYLCFKLLFDKNSGNRLNVIEAAMKSQAWDYVYLLNIFKEQLKFMYKFYDMKIPGSQPVNKNYKKVRRDLKLAISLLKIIQNKINFDGTDLYDCVYDNSRDDFSVKYKCNVYVNMKNLNRIVPDKSKHACYLKYPDEFYVIKAQRLLGKLIGDNLYDWWD